MVDILTNSSDLNQFEDAHEDISTELVNSAKTNTATELTNMIYEEEYDDYEDEDYDSDYDDDLVPESKGPNSQVNTSLIINKKIVHLFTLFDIKEFKS